MRLRLWLTLLLWATAAPCDATSLFASVARALRRIRDSPSDVRLSEEVWFEPLGPSPGASVEGTYRDEGTNGIEGTNRIKGTSGDDDLLRLADEVFDTHRLRWRDAVASGVDVAVRKERTRRRYVLDVSTRSDAKKRDDPDRRTFGLGMHRRRMQMVMLPIMYKLGVITTLLTGLTVLSLKGVTIGVVLLVLALTSFVAKLSKFGHQASYGPPPSYYDMFDRSSSNHQHQQNQQYHQYQQNQQQQHQQHDKNVHVHLHTAPGTVVDGPWYREGADEYYNTAAAATAAANPYAGYRDGGQSGQTLSAEKSGSTGDGGGVYPRWLG